MEEFRKRNRGLCLAVGNHLRSVAACLILNLIVAAAGAQVEDNRRWRPLADDGLHDPELEILPLLQEPAEALMELPWDYTGNQVLWVEALRQGYIEPRTNILPDTEIEQLDLDIIMGDTGETPLVRFPHLQHTEWLDCENCHEHIFRMESGVNNVSMFTILSGEHCGLCHGAVSFPLTECNRCHSVPRTTFTGTVGPQFPAADTRVDDAGD